MHNPGYVTFTVGNSCFLYDSATNGIIEIKSEVRAILNDYFKLERHDLIKAHPEIPLETIDRAISYLDTAVNASGMLKPLEPITYFSLLDHAQYCQKIKADLTQLLLNVTETCNMACHYCSQRQLDHQLNKSGSGRMSWDTAKSSIDYFLANTSAEHQVNIGFYGGEPLLEWPLLMKCIHYIREFHASRDIRVSLVTNGTLLNDEILSSLVLWDVYVQLSFDGPRSIHDDARVFKDGSGSHNRITCEVEKIRSIYPEYLIRNLSLHVTFNRQQDILEVFRYFNEVIPDDVQVSLKYVSGFSSGPLALTQKMAVRHEEKLEQLIEYYFTALRSGSRFRYDIFWELFLEQLHLVDRVIGPSPETCWPNHTCVPGTRRLFVTPEGFFTPCEKLCNTTWNIGDCSSGIEFSKVHSMFTTFAEGCQNKCQGCWAYRLCSFCFLHTRTKEIQNSSNRCTLERERILRELRRFVHIWTNEPKECHDHPDSLHFQVRNPQ